MHARYDTFRAARYNTIKSVLFIYMIREYQIDIILATAVVALQHVPRTPFPHVPSLPALPSTCRKPTHPNTKTAIIYTNIQRLPRRPLLPWAREIPLWVVELPCGSGIDSALAARAASMLMLRRAGREWGSCLYRTAASMRKTR